MMYLIECTDADMIYHPFENFSHYALKLLNIYCLIVRLTTWQDIILMISRLCLTLCVCVCVSVCVCVCVCSLWTSKPISQLSPNLALS